jgi:hypothetical protein
MELKAKNIADKDFILRLIKDDLINTKLIAGLESLGLSDVDNYHLHLGQTIFSLMGYETDSKLEEKVFDEYCELTRKIIYIDIFEHPEELNDFANQLYNKLKAELTFGNINGF